MRKVLLSIVCLFVFCSLGFKGICESMECPKDVHVYSDKNSPGNKYIASGWMGDTNDIKFNDQETTESAEGATSIKITYTAKKSQGNGWAGIYWQSAQSNWGSRETGFDLTGFNKLVFKAKGAQGGEVITKIKSGGITTNSATGDPVTFPDTVNVESGPIRLTNEWQEYYINLVNEDLSYVNGGFSIIFNVDQAGGEQTIYIDDIRYTYDPELTKETADLNLPFYVYADSGSLDNHFIASGWMPATAARDVRLDTNWKNSPFSGEACIKVEYKNTSGTRWAGVYWQNPAGNWGAVPNAGYDLQSATKLSFWARGHEGGEVVTEFKMGGLANGENIDSDSASYGLPVQLTTEWTKYEIDLRGRDLSYVIGGFAWATNIDVNSPEGIVFYLDEIRYE